MTDGVVEELNRMANTQGKTLYGLMNELGTIAIEANSNGIDLRDALEAKKLLDRAKRTRLVLVNQDSWYLASSKAFKSSRNEWLEHVYKTAAWYAEFFIDQSQTESKLRSLREFIIDLFWDCTDVTINEDRGQLKLKLLFVPEMPLEHSKVILKELEGLCNVVGYVLLKQTVKPGLIIAEFTELSAPVHS